MRSANVAVRAVLFFLASPAFVFAATLSFSPGNSTRATGEIFSVKVTVDPSGDSINATDGTISFDNTLLSLQSFSKDGSVFSLWTSEPVISQSKGTLEFSGGTPTAFSAAGTILTLKFKALKAGTAKLSFTKGSILAADGKGTDIYKGGVEGTVIVAAAAAVPTATETPVQNTDTAMADAGADAGPPPIAPTIDSNTFPRENDWYGVSSGVFTWRLPQDATGVRIGLSDSGSATPKEVQKATATSTRLTGIKDGVSYFLVQIRNGSGWGDVGKRKIQVDTQPPSDFTVSLQSGATPRLSFKAADALSGIDHYEILLGSTSVAILSAKDAADGTAPVPPQGGGAQLVVVRAFDMAQNMKEESATLDLPKVDKPKAASADTADNTQPSSSWFSFSNILVVLFAFVIGMLAMWIRSLRKNAEQMRLDVLQRIAELAEKNDRVYSAMREEFEQTVNDFDIKPQLSPEERALLEHLKEVLDISEEIVDSSIDELKKMVRESK